MSTTPTSTPVRHHRRGGLAGPVLLIVLGVVFLLPEFYPDWGFRKTWPVLLIGVGILLLQKRITGSGVSGPPGTGPTKRGPEPPAPSGGPTNIPGSQGM